MKMSFSPDKGNESPRVWRHILALVGTLFSLGSHAQFDGGVAPLVDASVPRGNMDAGVAQNRTPYQQQCISTEINIGARHPHLHQPGRPGVYLRNVCIHDLGVMLDPRASTALTGQPSFVLFRVLDVNPVTKELRLGIIPSNNPDMPHWGHPVVRDLVRSGRDLRFERDLDGYGTPTLWKDTSYTISTQANPAFTRESVDYNSDFLSLFPFPSNDGHGSMRFWDRIVTTQGLREIHEGSRREYGQLIQTFASPYLIGPGSRFFYSPICLMQVELSGSYVFQSCFHLQGGGITNGSSSILNFATLEWLERQQPQFSRVNQIDIQDVPPCLQIRPQERCSLITCLQSCEQDSRCVEVAPTIDGDCYHVVVAPLGTSLYELRDPGFRWDNLLRHRIRWTRGVQEQCERVYRVAREMAQRSSTEARPTTTRRQRQRIGSSQIFGNAVLPMSSTRGTPRRSSTSMPSSQSLPSRHPCDVNAARCSEETQVLRIQRQRRPTVHP